MEVKQTMAKRTTFHVTKRQDDDGWRVIKENAARASSVKDTKAEAVADARARAKAEPLGNTGSNSISTLVSLESDCGVGEQVNSTYPRLLSGFLVPQQHQQDKKKVL